MIRLLTLLVLLAAALPTQLFAQEPTSRPTAKPTSRPAPRPTSRPTSRPAPRTLPGVRPRAPRKTRGRLKVAGRWSLDHNESRNLLGRRLRDMEMARRHLERDDLNETLRALDYLQVTFDFKADGTFTSNSTAPHKRNSSSGTWKRTKNGVELFILIKNGRRFRAAKLHMRLIKSKLHLIQGGRENGLVLVTDRRPGPRRKLPGKGGVPKRSGKKN